MVRIWHRGEPTSPPELCRGRTQKTKLTHYPRTVLLFRRCAGIVLLPGPKVGWRFLKPRENTPVVKRQDTTPPNFSVHQARSGSQAAGVAVLRVPDSLVGLVRLLARQAAYEWVHEGARNVALGFSCAGSEPGAEPSSEFVPPTTSQGGSP